MWKTIYDDFGVKVPNAYDTFVDLLIKEHEPITRLELLNTSLRPIQGGSIFTPCACTHGNEGMFANFVSDGNIDVDITRGTRRTAEITLLNPTAEFTPAVEGFDSEGPWVGKIFINRIIRIWRGLHAGHAAHLYVPVGTFMVDGAEVIVEDNMSLVNLTLSDLWKKINKSHWSVQQKWAVGTHYNTIIRDILGPTGIAENGEFGYIIGSLSSRDDFDDKHIGIVRKYKRGDNRGEALKELGKRWGIDIYLDPMGRLRTEDRKSDKDKGQVWHFSSKEVERGINGGLLSVKRAFNDDNLYNHVILIGTGNEKKVIKRTKKDTRTHSKFSINKIGDRAFYLETDKISNDRQADRALKRLWEKRTQMSETINAEVISNPMLEGDDVIRVTEREKALLDSKYRLRRFNVPLVTSRQQIEAANIIRKDDIIS